MAARSSKDEGLVYGVVARNTVLLAEHAAKNGNYREVVERILEKNKSVGEQKKSYVYDEYAFHIVSSGGLVFMCLASQEFGRTRPFAFLEDIKNRFLASYGAHWREAKKMEMNSDFSRVMKKQMEFFSNNPNADPVRKLRNDVQEVKNIMTDNIDKVLERGEKISLLVERTDSLNAQASNFRVRSGQLKRHMCLKNFKLMLILAAIVLVVIFIIVVAACGGFSFHKCK